MDKLNKQGLNLKPVCGYESRYMVSDCGKVYSIKTDRILKSAIGMWGYPLVSLWDGVRSKSLNVHRLVARVFCEGYEDGLDVNHKDGNKTNNHCENLEWVTRGENIKHAWDSGLHKPTEKLRRQGTINLSAVKRPVTQYTKQGEFVATYESSMEASRVTGVRQSNISSCTNRHYKTSGGYVWRFENESFE